MADDLDLERGHDDADERPVSDRTKRRHKAQARREQEAIETRLGTIFSRLADSLEGRGDYELAEMIREDTKAMVGGLSSMARRVPAAAGAIVGGLAVLEPLIAFGRVFRLLLRRAGERRASADQEVWLDGQGGDWSPEPEPGNVHHPFLAADEPEPEDEPEDDGGTVIDGIPIDGPDVAKPWEA